MQQHGRGQSLSAPTLYRRVQSLFSERGSAFVPCRNRNLDQVFSLQFQRTVNRDNTVSFQNRQLQIAPVGWRGTLAGCSVTAHQHLDGTLSLSYGPHRLGRYDAAGLPVPGKAGTELGRGKGNAPFPRTPIPKTNPSGGGTTLKPDISLATKTGHFNLLTAENISQS